MSKFTIKITSRLQEFIEAQKLFFVATAPNSGRINLSLKEWILLELLMKIEFYG